MKETEINHAETKYAHLRFPMGGAITAAYVYNKIVDSDAVIASFSFCSPNDNFSKDTGRRRAKARLENGVTHEVPLDGKSLYTSIVSYFTEDIRESVAGTEDVSTFYSIKCMSPYWLMEEILMNLAVEAMKAPEKECCGGSCHCESEPVKNKKEVSPSFY